MLQLMYAQSASQKCNEGKCVYTYNCGEADQCNWLPVGRVFLQVFSSKHWPDLQKYLTIYNKIILSLSQDRLTIATDNVLRFLYCTIVLYYSKLIYKHYLQRSYDFARKSYLRKALRSSYKIFGKLDAHRKSIVTLALS